MWQDTIYTLLNNGTKHFIEVGPGNTLTKLCRSFKQNISVSSTETPMYLKRSLTTIEKEFKGNRSMFNGNEVALVIGGSRGIGKSITMDLAKQGLTVYFTFQSNQKSANEIANIIGEKGGKAFPMYVDITNEDSIHKLFQHIRSKEKE